MYGINKQGEKSAMANKHVYILLTDTGTVLTRAIKLYTRKPYNHASIAFDYELTEVYSFGRKNPRNPLIGGFVKENLNNCLFERATGVIYRLTVSETEYHRMKGFVKQIADDKENFRYNLIGLIAVLFNIELDRENAFFCSEFVATVLEQSDQIKFNMPLSLVTPSDLLEIGKLELIYEGILTDYKDKYTRCLTYSPSVFNAI